MKIPHCPDFFWTAASCWTSAPLKTPVYRRTAFQGFAPSFVEQAAPRRARHLFTKKLVSFPKENSWVKIARRQFLPHALPIRPHATATQGPTRHCHKKHHSVITEQQPLFHSIQSATNHYPAKPPPSLPCKEPPLSLPCLTRQSFYQLIA